MSGLIEKRSKNGHYKLVYCEVLSQKLIYSHPETRQVKGIVDFAQNHTYLHVLSQNEF
jgi:hypothetical protein